MLFQVYELHYFDGSEKPSNFDFQHSKTYTGRTKGHEADIGMGTEIETSKNRDFKAETIGDRSLFF